MSSYESSTPLTHGVNNYISDELFTDECETEVNYFLSKIDGTTFITFDLGCYSYVTSIAIKNTSNQHYNK